MSTIAVDVIKFNGNWFITPLCGTTNFALVTTFLFQAFATGAITLNVIKFNSVDMLMSTQLHTR